MSVGNKPISVAVGLVMALAPALPAAAAFHNALRERLKAVGESAAPQQGEPGPSPVAPAARERFSEAREAIVRGSFLKMVRRFGAVLDRLEKIADRIQSRISKTRVIGSDEHLRAQQALDRASSVLRDARAAADEFKRRLDLSRSAEDARRSLKDVRALVDGVRDKIKAARSAFVEASAAIRGMGAKGVKPLAPAAEPAPANP